MICCLICFHLVDLSSFHWLIFKLFHAYFVQWSILRPTIQLPLPPPILSFQAHTVKSCSWVFRWFNAKDDYKWFQDSLGMIWAEGMLQWVLWWETIWIQSRTKTVECFCKVQTNIDDLRGKRGYSRNILQWSKIDFKSRINTNGDYCYSCS